jgi:NAD(P)-dependent dehydrogenase (short-subunit alcohol dehydrogenase family)
MSDTQTTAVVTGSSGGIGLDIARAFLAQGGNVVLNGRDADRLAKAAAGLGQPRRHRRTEGGNHRGNHRPPGQGARQEPRHDVRGLR